MVENFLIDTNIIIYYLDNKIPESQINKIEDIFISSFNISTITKIEILGWHKISISDKKKIEQFLKNAHILYIDKEIEETAIKLRQKKNTSIPDTIIAATAIENNLTIVTRNEADFSFKKGMKIFNPFQN